MLTVGLHVGAQVLPPATDVGNEELLDLLSSFFLWIARSEGEDAHVLQRQTKRQQRFVQLLRKLHANIEAWVLKRTQGMHKLNK